MSDLLWIGDPKNRPSPDFLFHAEDLPLKLVEDGHPGVPGPGHQSIEHRWAEGTYYISH